jgi:hypothetical protein
MASLSTRRQRNAALAAGSPDATVRRGPELIGGHALNEHRERYLAAL